MLVTRPPLRCIHVRFWQGYDHKYDQIYCIKSMSKNGLLLGELVAAIAECRTQWRPGLPLSLFEWFEDGDNEIVFYLSQFSCNCEIENHDLLDCACDDRNVGPSSCTELYCVHQAFSTLQDDVSVKVLYEGSKEDQANLKKDHFSLKRVLASEGDSLGPDEGMSLRFEKIDYPHNLDSSWNFKELSFRNNALIRWNYQARLLTSGGIQSPEAKNMSKKNEDHSEAREEESSDLREMVQDLKRRIAVLEGMLLFSKR